MEDSLSLCLNIEMQNDNQNDQFQQSQISPNPNYDFILNPPSGPKKILNLSSLKSKILTICAGLLILIIVFVVFENLISTPIFSSTDFLAVLRDQQEILHVISTDTTTNQEIGLLSSTNKNLVASTNLVISSDQQNTLSYLKNNGVVFPLATISLGINPSLDNQINSSINSNNYNQTLDQVLANLFSTYDRDLKLTYNSEHGSKGKALLKSEYKNIYLLNKGLNA